MGARTGGKGVLDCEGRNVCGKYMSFVWGLARPMVKLFPVLRRVALWYRMFGVFLRRFFLRFPEGEFRRWLLLLRKLWVLPWIVVWFQRYNPQFESRAGVDLAFVRQGLGGRGCCFIPQDIWNRYVPPSLLQALVEASTRFPVSGPPVEAVRVLLDALVRDRFILPCPGAQPNCRLFAIPKSSQKVSLIADLRF